jgi:hypothetical protein
MKRSFSWHPMPRREEWISNRSMSAFDLSKGSRCSIIGDTCEVENPITRCRLPNSWIGHDDEFDEVCHHIHLDSMNWIWSDKIR